MRHNTILYRWGLENKEENPHLFYHFSLQKFNNIKDVYGRGHISLLLSKPDQNSVELLRTNGFAMWGKPGEYFRLYKIDLSSQTDKIKYYYIASSTEEPDEETEEGKKYFNENHRLSNKEKSDWLCDRGYTRTWYTDYNDMVVNLKPEWLDFSALAKRQVNLCNTKYKDYKSMYAPFIPHLIVYVKKFETLKVTCITR